MKVLIIDSGGREHAICLQFFKSSKTTIFVTTNNIDFTFV
jgi:phosphoribosylamine-glycine ligase